MTFQKKKVETEPTVTEAAPTVEESPEALKPFAMAAFVQFNQPIGQGQHRFMTEARWWIRCTPHGVVAQHKHLPGGPGGEVLRAPWSSVSWWK